MKNIKELIKEQDELKTIKLKLKWVIKSGEERTYEEDVMVSNNPKPSCSKCYGRGFKSYNITTKKFELCGCVNKDANRLKNRYMKASALYLRGMK